MAICGSEPPLGGPRDCLGVWWAQRLAVGPLVRALVLLWLREYQGDCTVHRATLALQQGLFPAVLSSDRRGAPRIALTISTGALSRCCEQMETRDE